MGLQSVIDDRSRPTRRRYTPPRLVQNTTLGAVLSLCERNQLEPRQMSLLASGSASGDPTLYYSGQLSVLCRPAVAIVGARAVSPQGIARASRLAREIAEAGITVVSGLAKGVDTAAHQAAIAVGGKTAAVIGTGIDQAYPAENATLQEDIAEYHLLLTQFAAGERVFQSNFPKRNRIMAAVSDGTVIVEASDSSGTLHQAAECERLGRWLFILKSVYDNPSLKWPKRFSNYSRMRVVSTSEDVIGAVVR